MTVSIVYDTRFGNNAALARRLSDSLESHGHGVSIHPISEARTSEIPAADLYLVGSPTQLGSLPMKMERFLKNLKIRENAMFAAFSTWAEPGSTTPQKLESAMEANGARKVMEPLVFPVKDLRGPIEDGWERKADAWAEALDKAIQS